MPDIFDKLGIPRLRLVSIPKYDTSSSYYDIPAYTEPVLELSESVEEPVLELSEPIMSLITILEATPKLASKPKGNFSKSPLYKLFVDNMNKYERETGDIMSDTKRLILTKIAFNESGYRQKSGASGSSAVGYFGMTLAGRKHLGTTLQYLNNPNLQFRAASELYDYIQKAYKKHIERARSLGMSELEIVLGFWFRPQSMINYINGRGDNFRDSQGSTLASVLKKTKNQS